MRTRRAPDQPLRPGRWWTHPLVRGIVFVVVVAMGATSTTLFEQNGRASDWIYLAAELLSCLAGYAVVVLLLEQRRRPVELAPSRWPGLFAGLGLGAATCLVVFAILWAGGWRTISGTNPNAPLLQPILMMGVVAGISEEIVFRGILFRLVEAGLGTWGATLVSGAVFGLVHITNPQATWWGAVAIALEAGVMFGLLYALTRSLWVVIGVHAAWNVVQGPVLGSAVSGATNNGDGLLVSHPAGPELVSGGVFGLEASLVAVMVWSAISVWLARALATRGLVVAPAWRRRVTAGPAGPHWWTRPAGSSPTRRPSSPRG